MDSKYRIGFIGAGRVGASLAHAFAAAGYPVTAVASQSFTSAQRLAESVAGCRAYESAQSVAGSANVVFITTPDRAISAVADSLSWRKGQVVVHTSGAYSSEILASAHRSGARVASFHPLQTFAIANAPVNLAGVTLAIEGDSEAVVHLKSLAESVGGCWVEIRPEDKVLYHAAAVVASNYLVTLVDAAAELWQTFGVGRDDAVRALLPLLRGTVGNIESVGLPDALTGPIVRGDVATVANHLQALADRSHNLVELYRTLASRTLPLALERGRIDSETAAALAGLIAGSAEEAYSKELV